MEKALKATGVVFLAFGAYWFAMSGYMNFTATLGAKRDFDLRVAKLQADFSQYEARRQQLFGALGALKNPEVDGIVSKYK